MPIADTMDYRDGSEGKGLKVNGTVTSCRKAMQGTPGRCYKMMKALVEVGYSWGLMCDWLGELVDDVVLAHAGTVRAIAEDRIKADKIDSETLAHFPRAGPISQAYAPSKDAWAIKQVLRQRMFSLRVRTMLKNRIKALLAQHCIELSDVSDLYDKTGLQ